MVIARDRLIECRSADRTIRKEPAWAAPINRWPSNGCSCLRGSHPLRNRISRDPLPTGVRHNDVELSDVMGLSRTPLGDAIESREPENLVEIPLREGAAVAEIGGRRRRRSCGGWRRSGGSGSRWRCGAWTTTAPTSRRCRAGLSPATGRTTRRAASSPRGHHGAHSTVESLPRRSRMAIEDRDLPALARTMRHHIRSTGVFVIYSIGENGRSKKSRSILRGPDGMGPGLRLPFARSDRTTAPSRGA